ncbi:Crp/Fnr family transcriptional regulator [Enhygromyxa salina]|uniref:Crp/Fnr family transcriptional regulator n=1 Tax=Enhygromyxa salina TaxID=215803 RepID=UPI0015E7779F|nr:cyclic nucleotide-binding domain-containing protein [Enhygromyxa salina]
MLELTTRLATVHRATSAAERDAIYRMRYEIRVAQRGQVEGAGVDHDRQMVFTVYDELPRTIHFYTSGGSADGAGELDAVARMRRFNPGEVPDEVRERWSLDFVTNLDSLAIAEFSELLARPEVAAAQERLSVLSLFKAGFEACMEPGGADLIVFDAHPGLITHYAKLFGARRYGGDPIERSAGKGVGVPMVIAVSDTAHLERVGSLFTPLSWKTFVLGRRARADIGCFSVRFVDDLRDDVDPEQTWPMMEERFFRRGVERWSFFEGLRQAIIDELMARGTLREVAEGEEVVSEGGEDGEMFVVLDGCLEILAGGKSVDVAGRGELIGEVSISSPERRRTATIRALLPSRLLTLTHAALRALALGDAEAGHQVMLNLTRFIAERFAEKARVVASLDEELERLRLELHEANERLRGL